MAYIKETDTISLCLVNQKLTFLKKMFTSALRLHEAVYHMF